MRRKFWHAPDNSDAPLADVPPAPWPLVYAYRALIAAFPRLGNTGIRFRIAHADVDLLPFGEIEDPQGFVEPPSRGETLSVWAFEEIFAASLPLALSPTMSIHIPTVAGYAAAKLGARLDRSEWREVKDAADLALILYWYAESADVATTIGPARLAELLARWPGAIGLLIRELELRGGPAWPRDPRQRRGLLDASTRGLTGTPP